MAWGDKRDRLVAGNAAMEREIALLRDMIVDLKAEKIDLKDQLQNTQEALIAKESPEAYRDQKYAEEQARLSTSNEMTDAEREAARLQALWADTTFRHLQNLEGDLFQDADDMIQLLTRASSLPMGDTKSLHGNEES